MTDLGMLGLSKRRAQARTLERTRLLRRIAEAAVPVGIERDQAAVCPALLPEDWASGSGEPPFGLTKSRNSLLGLK